MVLVLIPDFNVFRIGRKRKSGGKFKVNRFSQLQLQSPFFISDCATGQEASDEEFSGFDRGLEAEKVVGVTEDEGNLMVYIRLCSQITHLIEQSSAKEPASG